MNESQQIVQYQKMTQTPVSLLIVKLGVPTILSMLITSIYNMADTYFVGQLGTSASGAIGIVFGLMAILQAFGFMFGHGAGSILSRKLGEKDTDSASRFASTGFFLSLLFGLLIGIFGLLFITPLMYLLGSTATILPYAKQYATYILLAAPFMTGSCVLNNILRYEGRAAFAMIGLVSGGLLNIALDPLFIFVFHMGTAGAGAATAISQCVSFFLLLLMFLLRRTQSRLSLRLFSRRFSDIAKIVATGLPSLIRQGLGSISTMLLNGQAAVYGDAAVAAMSIVNRISMLIFSVGLGIGQGFQPVAAFNYGAGKFSRVRKGFWFTAAAGEVLLGTAAVFCFLFAAPLITLFRNDPAVISFGIPALWFQCVACLFQPFAVCTNMLFQSIGKSGLASFLSSLRNGIFFIPLILLLPALYGILGVQITQAAADVLSFFVCVPLLLWYFKHLPKDKE